MHFGFSPTGHSLAYFGLVDGQLCLIRNGSIVGDRPYLRDPDWEFFRLAWNPKDESLATVTWDRGRKGLIRKEGIPVGCDYDETFEPTFSPDGESFAFIARSGDKWLVVRGGVRVGDLYDGARSLTFTPDSCSVMFVARVGETSFVVKDGSRVSRRYKGSAEMILSPSGRSYALTIAEEGGKQYVVKNERRIGPGFDLLLPPRFPPEGDALAFHGRLPDGRFIVVKDGKTMGETYQDVHPFGPVLSRDGRSIAFRARVKEGDVEKEVVIKDGVPLHEETHPAHAVVTPLGGAAPCLSGDGTSIAYDVRGQAGRRRVIRDGQRVGEEYDWVNHLAISPDGRTLLFMAGRGAKSFYVSNGERVCQEYTYVTPPVTSHDAKKVIFAGVLDNAVYRNEIPW
jgi:hypothetical protein